VKKNLPEFKFWFGSAERRNNCNADYADEADLRGFFSGLAATDSGFLTMILYDSSSDSGAPKAGQIQKIRTSGRKATKNPF
jgi:hypothetical protein